jgi:ABC-2 type transport system permease protein
MIIAPLLLAAATGNALRYEKFATVPVAVVDEDGSEYSNLLISRLSGKEGLKLVAASREDAQKMLEDMEVEQLFIIKKGFGDSIAGGIYEELIGHACSPYSYSAGFTREIIAGEAMGIIMANMAAEDVVHRYGELGIIKGDSFKDDVLDHVDSLWEPDPLLTVEYKELRGGTAGQEVQEIQETNLALPVSSASSAGLITAFIMFYILYGSSWLIEERLNCTIKRLGAVKGAIAASFAGNVLAMAAAGALQILVYCAALKIFLGFTIYYGILSYVVLFVYLLSVISTGMFLSSVMKTQAQLQAGAPMLALITGFVGGCFWNFIELPEQVRRLSLLTPQGWALQGLNGLLQGSAGLSAVLVPLLVLFILSLILLPASYIIINIRLRRG